MAPGPAAKATAEGRFIACAVEGGPDNGNLTLASIYLDPAPGADHENDGRIIKAMAWAKALGHGTWAIAGDWNRHPSKIDPDLLQSLSACIVAATSPTCHSATGEPSSIDWWVVGPGMASRAPAAGLWQESGLPTHKPVELRILGPQRPLMVTALRRPIALPPPPEPAGPEEERKREDAGLALEQELKTCEDKLSNRQRTDSDNEAPARATGEALAEWAAACETWLWVAAGNAGSLPKKYKGRCTAPVRRPVARQKPGKDGFVLPPGTATAAGIAARLAEVGRQLSGNPATAASTPEIRRPCSPPRGSRGVCHRRRG